MRHWFSPLPLNPALVALLSEAGLEPWPGGQGSTPEADCLLLYDQLDRLILAAAAAGAELSLQQIAEGYSQLLACADATGQPLQAAWRLERFDAATLQQWLKAGSTPAAATVQPAAAIPPLQAAAILGLLEAQPELLDAYNDLELRAELLGDEPDLHQRQRLRQACGEGDGLLQTLLQTLQTPAALRDLEEQLAAKDGELRELREVREEAELTLLQLHQAQEELEHYFLLSREQHQLLNKYGAQQPRVQRLIAQLTLAG